MSDTNKSEKPTPRRQQKARERGQVARSRDLANTIACIGGIIVFVWQAPEAVQRWRHLLHSSLDIGNAESMQPTAAVLFWNVWFVVRWTVPILLACWILALGSSVAQGGFVFAADSLTPKLERMSPTNKLKQLFSIAGLSGLLKSLIPFTAIAYISFDTLKDKQGAVLHASSLGLKGMLSLLASLSLPVAWKSALVLLGWAGIDYMLIRQKLQHDLMMSHDEVREEVKETEGNPAIKSRIRKLQRQLRRRKMLQDTEKATVVVVNPTHFAVALRYELTMSAPIAVAKGRDLLAQRIKEIARWKDIPILENPPLAQALYRTVEVGQAIPAELYTAVAEILAMVYRAQAEARKNQAKRFS